METHDIKDKILKGSEKLFMKYGIRSISMDDIARELSISKKTLYQYFVDKDELVMLVAKNHMGGVQDEFDAITTQAENAIHELHLIAICLKRDMEQTNPIVVRDVQKFHPKAWELMEEFRTGKMFNSVMRNLKQGIKDGHFRSDFNPRIIATLRLALIHLPFDENVFPAHQFNLAEVHSELFEHFVFGITTEKGKKLYLRYKENYIHQTKTKTTKHETIL